MRAGDHGAWAPPGVRGVRARHAPPTMPHAAIRAFARSCTFLSCSSYRASRLCGEPSGGALAATAPSPASLSRCAARARARGARAPERAPSGWLPAPRPPAAAVARAQATEEEEDWWCTSISEYAAARGSTGSKLLGGSLSVCGSLQIIEGSLLSQLCVAPYSAAALLWAGGIACIVLGQVEASDECRDTPEMARVKQTYAVVHAVAAVAFVALTTAGVIIISSAVDWLAAGLALGGMLLFFLAVGAQNLTGNYVGVPSLCPLPQRPADRRPGAGRWPQVHRWLDVKSNRTLLARLVLFDELAGTALIIFAVTYLSIQETQGYLFCAQAASCFRTIR